VLSRRRQRAKIDEYADYLFIVLHFPRFDKRTGRLQATELNVFVAEDLVITLPNEPLKPLSALWSRCERSESAREQYMSKGSGYLLYEIVDTMYDYCFPILDKIGHKLDEIEDGIFEGRSKEMVRQISNTKQEIIAFRKIIGPEISTLRVLETKTALRFTGDLELYFDDVIDSGQRIWDILENNKEVVEALEDTNETVVQHGLNDTLLVLTILNALVLPMTFVTGLWGMNVELPLQHREQAFWLILVLIAVVVTVFVLAFQRWRRF
jgi:magnesium transporter